VADLKMLAERFVGSRSAELAFAEIGAAGSPPRSIGPREAQLTERLIAGVIGSSSARVIVTSALSGGRLDVGDVVALLDSTSAELQFSRDLMAVTLNSIGQGVSVVDRDLNLVAWNRRYAELLGFPGELLQVGRPIAELIRYNAMRGECGPGDVEQHVERRVAHMRRGQEHSYERLRPGGQVLKIMGNPMPGGGYVTTYTDITAEKEAQNVLASANQQLEERVHERTEELSREVERNATLAEELKAISDSKTRFLAAASHDLLQPLHAARLFAGALKDQATPEHGTQHLAHAVDRSIASAEQLIRTLLDISKLDAGGLKPSPELIDVEALLRDLASEFEPLATERGLTLRLRARRGLKVYTDRALLKSMVRNFLSNAVRYTPKGRIVLAARRRGNKVRLEVWDTGSGIPDDKLDLIFEEFHRLPNAEAADSGVGLGLAIVRRASALIEADVAVSSRLGRGSCFSATLPLTEGAKAARAKPKHLRAIGSLEGATVLAVDDQPVVLEALGALIAAWGGRPVFAKTVSEAIAVAQQEHPEVGLLDYQLGDSETGLDAVEALRELCPDIRLAIVTADAHLTAEEAQIPVLRKPLDPQALRRWLLQG
jgi:signal transduction histidine kinase